MTSPQTRGREEEEEEVPTLSSSETTSLEAGMEDEEAEAEAETEDTPNCLFLLAEAAKMILEEEEEEEGGRGKDGSIKPAMKLDQDMVSSQDPIQQSSFILHQEEGKIKSLQASACHGDGHYLFASHAADSYTDRSDQKLSVAAGYGGHEQLPSQLMRYECTTCNKSFSSHQALGGHRASHRKTKGCSAAAVSGASWMEEAGPEVGEANGETGDAREVQLWQNRSIPEKEKSAKKTKKIMQSMSASGMNLKKEKKQKQKQKKPGRRPHRRQETR